MEIKSETRKCLLLVPLVGRLRKSVFLARKLVMKPPESGGTVEIVTAPNDLPLSFDVESVVNGYRRGLEGFPILVHLKVPEGVNDVERALPQSRGWYFSRKAVLRTRTRE